MMVGFGQESRREVVCKKTQKGDVQKADESFSKKFRQGQQEKKNPAKVGKKREREPIAKKVLVSKQEAKKKRLLSFIQKQVRGGGVVGHHT